MRGNFRLRVGWCVCVRDIVTARRTLCCAACFSEASHLFSFIINSAGAAILISLRALGVVGLFRDPHYQDSQGDTICVCGCVCVCVWGCVSVCVPV